MSKETVHPLVIIGSGPAGLTAAVYAARANVHPVVIEGTKPGGQLMYTSYVENWPGDTSVLGPTLMQRMREHAAHFGAIFITGDVAEVDFHARPFTLITTNQERLQAQSVIVASGATSKKLGIPGEETYWSKGVTTCAVCDGAFYPNKKVIIVGGGDTAMEDASFMTRFTDDITIVHILDKLTASHAMQQRVLANKNIQIIYASTVTEIRGNGEHVTGVVIRNQQTKKERELQADAVFVAVGLAPNTSIFKGQLELLDNGYIKVTDLTKTSVEGVFVAGDVADFRYRQAVTAAGSGCMAALDAERYIALFNREE